MRTLDIDSCPGDGGPRAEVFFRPVIQLRPLFHLAGQCFHIGLANQLLHPEVHTDFM